MINPALRGFVLAVASAIAAAGWVQSPASTQEQPETFTALAVNMGNIGPTQPVVVDIAIRRWMSEEERGQLITTLIEKGSEAFLEALQKTKPVGTIRTPDSIGYDLRYAQESPDPAGGRRIVIITDRPISFWEARSQPRTIDYRFTTIELRMKPGGRGEGKLSIATKVTPVGKTIYLEDYATQPVTLQNVRSKKTEG